MEFEEGPAPPPPCPSILGAGSQWKSKNLEVGQPGLPGSPLTRLLPPAIAWAVPWGLQYGTWGPERPWGLTADPVRGWKLRKGQVPVRFLK